MRKRCGIEEVGRPSHPMRRLAEVSDRTCRNAGWTPPFRLLLRVRGSSLSHFPVPPLGESNGRRELLVRLSREKYAIRWEVVEEKIRRRTEGRETIN